MADTIIDAGAVQSEVNSANSALSSFEGALQGLVSSVAAANKTIADSFTALGKGVNTVASGIGNVGQGIDSIASAFTNTAVSLNALSAAFPAVSAGIMQMLVTMEGITGYIPQLIIFTAAMAILALMGEGLSAAGAGILGIGLGLVAMTSAMSAVVTLLPVFIDCLAGITSNVGGIVLFVLLAAAVLIMAIALEKLNEQFNPFVQNMEKLSGLFSVGFVASFVVFGAMMIAMSLFMAKAASGMDKVTQAMTQQAAKLAILNPLLAVQAVLTNPIVGAITVGLATASGLLVGALFPAMATGGVVSKPTMALVGEGKYPEAVVPLGDSPQFTNMKAEIANAVLQGLTAMNYGSGGGSAPSEIVFNLDGERFARAIIPKINGETRRNGYVLQTKGV